MPRHKQTEPTLRVKVVLEVNRRLLAAIWHRRQQLILERQCILFAVDAGEVEKNAVIGGQVPRAVLACSALACEPGASQRLGIQCAMETSR